ncbi:MarR family transcriptional regulator [Clostridia bacterium]|nr:MarR family transcriptional regulator [Clostridia bacterium]
MTDSKKVINKILVELFKDILGIEAAALKNSEFGELTVTEFHIIESIGLDGGKTMSETALLAGVTIGTLTTSINRLIRKGAVQRKRDDNDRRVVLVSLTELGRNAYLHHEEFHQEMTNSVIEFLDTEDDGVLIQALSSLQEFFSRKAKEYGRK